MAFAIRQPELDDSMRCALLGWLSEVAAEYKMANSTYFLTVRLLDRVLMQLPIKKTKFQLLGCACLMLAGKLEEIEVSVLLQTDKYQKPFPVDGSISKYSVCLR